MTAYVEILAQQEPFEIGTDESSRVMYSVNFVARAVGPVSQWEEEILAKLTTAGLITSSNSGVGTAWQIPSGEGPYTQLFGTGGPPRQETHDGVVYDSIAFQVVVRAGNDSARAEPVGYKAARDKARAIRDELDGTRDVTLTA